MANKKFSDFTQKTSTADVDFVVGYDGSDNVRISPSNLTADSLPLAGGTMTGDIAFSSTSNGVKLGGLASGNLLNDYEEGTFDLQWGYARFGGVTYYDLSDFGGTKSETSTYVKVGRHVTVTSYFKFGSYPTAWTDNTAFAFIRLPFTVAEGYYGNGTYYMNPGAGYPSSAASESPCLFPTGYASADSLLGFHSNTNGFNNIFQTLSVGDLPQAFGGSVELRLSFSFYTTD